MLLNCGVGEDSWESLGLQANPACLLKEISPEYSLEGLKLKLQYFSYLMLKLKLQYFGHLMQRTWLIGKDPDVGKDWRQEEKGMTEDEMVEWHHWLNVHELEEALGVGDGERSLVCCNPWGCRVRPNWATDMNWTKLLSLDILSIKKKFSEHNIC